MNTEEHRKFFAEFCRWEISSGGPDPQLPTVAEMAKDAASDEEALWRGCCYIGVYNVPYAEVLWRGLPFAKCLQNPLWMRHWLDTAYARGHITTRIERRAARRSDQMYEYLRDCQHFIAIYDRLCEACADAATPEAAFEIAWEQVLRIETVGRYAAIKLIEYLRRYHALPVGTPDIRPENAWSPRRALAILFPDRGLANKDNSEAALKLAHETCLDAIAMLAEQGIKIDLFQLQVLLCEYRESAERKYYYPGRSHDSELKYARRAEEEWEYLSDIWRARKKLFPIKHLGEMMGWELPRQPVTQCLAVHGYTWSDLRFDYKATTNFAHPKEWSP